MMAYDKQLDFTTMYVRRGSNSLGRGMRKWFLIVRGKCKFFIVGLQLSVSPDSDRSNNPVFLSKTKYQQLLPLDIAVFTSSYLSLGIVSLISAPDKCSASVIIKALRNASSHSYSDTTTIIFIVF
jgi:hypothetical protein